jgi:hypothetical protein
VRRALFEFVLCLLLRALSSQVVLPQVLVVVFQRLAKLSFVLAKPVFPPLQPVLLVRLDRVMVRFGEVGWSDREVGERAHPVLPALQSHSR